MAELKVTFTLRDRDLKHLRRIMRQATTAVKNQPEDSIIAAAMAMAGEVRKFKPPDYVVTRIDKLETLVELLQDEDYNLPLPMRRKILSALAYFTDPQDLIPDPVPGLGFLDDAIMIELMAQDLRYELAAYAQFRRYRESAEIRPWTQVGKASLKRKLSSKRDQLRAEVDSKEVKRRLDQKRRELRKRVDEQQAHAAGVKTGGFRLW